ncbi:TonB-linked outer membrane protein, SusC/RagA family [Chitinophaga sp. CF118]|uniref:SusC/RagA family TonB-linked outer membrane protein n=1 Tax=Chitinophaga sp. CF118 TaxID=1884367 RepID=UPI0008E885AE|nr:SusC/RagA family TonB-linked outer membrane protein [Chitinophaga sp. CF118]SFE14295.1 TonB-linked outer membrane protein, SusC/RagA family [Chitinophaga sp. CF118]
MKGKSYFGKVCIAASFLIMSLLTGEEALFAQVTLPSGTDNISINVKNKNIVDVMVEIAAKSNLNFHYDKATIDPTKKVTLHCDNVPINKLLNMLSAQTGFDFLLRDDKIIVGLPGSVASSEEDQQYNDAGFPKEISGQIMDSRGRPIPGVTILIKNTSKGAQSNETGSFTIEAAEGEILVFRSVGFLSREIPASSRIIDVTLQENVKELNELVVTALGFTKSTRELSYATGQLGSENFSTIKDANVINSLSGKVAGVMINRSASGIGGSARVILRGNKSTRENQPLYIIDGVPMANFTPSQPTDIWGQSSGIVGSGGRDGGDGISNINPDDIASISILKGASAAALYGSQAANGVIMITTRKGSAGKGHISFSSDFTIEKPLLLPKLQYRYAQTIMPYKDDEDSPQPGSPDSWGNPLKSPDHVKGFFNTGTTLTNALSFSGGADKTQFYLSYSNTRNKGILPINKLDRHTFNARITSNMLNNRLSLDANISFLAQNILNRPSSGLYYNALTGLYTFPRGLDFNSYKQYEYFDQTRNMPLQNWWNIHRDLGWTGQDDQQNPYWVLQRDQREESRYRSMASLALKYQIRDWVSLQMRWNFDKSYDQYELKAYAGTQQVLSPPNGRYTLEKETNTQLYTDMILTVYRKLSNQFHLQTMLGANITDVKAHDRSLISTNPTATAGLIYSNKFTVENISGNALDAQQNIEHKQLQALFGSAQLSLHNSIFLDLTGRNDWSSTFAFTPIRSKGYFYYSTGLSTILSDLIKMPSTISFAKARISYARAGNDIAAYVSRPARFNLQTIGGVTRVNFNTKAPYPGIYLKPEDNRSLEAGTEIRLLKDRISIDFTWYKNNNYQQYMEVRAPSGSGYLYYYLNLGNIQNKGIELSLSGSPVQNKQFRWVATINATINRNSVVKLSSNNIPGAGPDNYYILTDFLTNMYGSFIKEGGAWGDIYTNKELYKNEKGQYVLDDQDNLVTRNVFKKVGNPNPKLMLGWNNTISYKQYSLSCLIDGRFGGEVMSVTNSVLDNYGVSETSANARDNGGVDLNAVYQDGSPFTGKYDARKYYTAIGGRAGSGEMYLYDATNIRLRELSLTCQLPVKSKFINRIQVGMIAKNICFFKLSAPFDPEVSMSSGNGLQGIDVFGVSATRSIGANVRVIF